jgi:hypothetical protein
MMNGEIDPDFSTPLSDDFNNLPYKQMLSVEISANDEDKPVLERAIATNDYVSNLYLCYIPTEEGIPGVNKTTTKDGVWYAYDYSVGAWIDYTVTEENLVPCDGMLMHQNTLIMSGLGYLFQESRYESRDDYVDNSSAITMKLQSPWLGSEDPSILKKFLRLKVWSFAKSYFLSSYLTLKTYLDFRDAASHTTATMDFTSSSTIERLIKLRGGQKARSLMVEFSNNNLHEAPVVTGYEIEIAPVFDKEIKE